MWNTTEFKCLHIQLCFTLELKESLKQTTSNNEMCRFIQKLPPPPSTWYNCWFNMFSVYRFTTIIRYIIMRLVSWYHIQDSRPRIENQISARQFLIQLQSLTLSKSRVKIIESKGTHKFYSCRAKCLFILSTIIHIFPLLTYINYHTATMRRCMT